MVDFLIIGQGLAGTSLSLQLIAKNKSVLVLDEEKPSTSSMIAAGIMNPVTGRRFVKSWRYNEVFDFAEKYYQQWEKDFGKKIFKPSKISRALFSHEEHHDFLAKTNQKEYAPFLSELQSIDFEQHFKPATAWIQVKGARLKIKAYLDHSRKFLKRKNAYQRDSFDHNLIKRTDDFWEYKTIKAKKIIFCEGAKIVKNPFFKMLPFVPAKGEVLIIKVPGLTSNQIYKHKCFLVPFGHDHTFWVGSTYEWDFKDAEPSEKKKEELLKKLKQSLKIDFEVLDHYAAIRPAGKDRRPYIGEHFEHEGLYLFNALGTKGASLSPYWADHLVSHLISKTDLDEEVDINRLLS